jgi:hypothetical protein
LELLLFQGILLLSFLCGQHWLLFTIVWWDREINIWTIGTLNFDLGELSLIGTPWAFTFLFLYLKALLGHLGFFLTICTFCHLCDKKFWIHCSEASLNMWGHLKILC